MADFVQEIIDRKARRALAETPISVAILRRILDAASNAPSCSNKQPWRFLVCNEKKSLAKARNMLSDGNYWAKKAPVLIIIMTSLSEGCIFNENRHYALFDCGLAAENLMLQATHENLIAHPMAGFNATGLKTEFNMPEDTIPIVVIALGYPGDDSHLSEMHKKMELAARERKQLSEVTSYNTLEEEASPAEIK